MEKHVSAPRLTGKRYAATLITHELVGSFDMATTTISPNFQIQIPKDVREKLHLSPDRRVKVVEKGGVMTRVREVPLKNLKGSRKGMPKADIRKKQYRH